MFLNWISDCIVIESSLDFRLQIFFLCSTKVLNIPESVAKTSLSKIAKCSTLGEGGNLLGCDECIESFCRQCIQRNLGRGAISAAENSDNWKCYICDTRPIKKLQEFAAKLQKANQQRSEWQHEKERKAKERKLKKAKQAKLGYTFWNFETLVYTKYEN